MWFQNMQMRNKLIVGFGIILLIMIIMGFQAINGIHIVGEELRELENANAQLEMNILKMRVLESRFLNKDLYTVDFYMDKDIETLKEFDALYINSLELIEYINQNTKDETVQANMSKIHESLNNYFYSFYEVVDTYWVRGYKNFGLIGELTSLRSTLSGYVHVPDAVKMNIQKLKDMENEYFINHDPEILEAFSMKIEYLVEQVETSEIQELKKGALIAWVLRYEEVFREAITIENTIGLNASEGLIGAYEKEVADLKSAVDENNEIIQTAINSEISLFNNGVLNLFLIAFIIVSVIFVAMTYSITKRFKQIVTGVEAMAKGDLSQELPDMGQDELGRIAIAFNDMQAQLSGMVEEVKESTGRLNDSSYALAAISDENGKVSEELFITIRELRAFVRTQENTIYKMAQVIKKFTEDVSQAACYTKAVSEISKDVEKQVRNGSDCFIKVKRKVKSVKEKTRRTNDAIRALNEQSIKVYERRRMLIKVKDDMLKRRETIECDSKELSLMFEYMCKLLNESSEMYFEIQSDIESVMLSYHDTFGELVESDILDQSSEEGLGGIIEAIRDLTLKTGSVSASIINMGDLTSSIDEMTDDMLKAVNELHGRIDNVVGVTDFQSASTGEVAASASELSLLSAQLRTTVSSFTV